MAQGFMDNLVGAITDFYNGYQDNYNNDFTQSQRNPVLDVRGFKNRVNPEDYTTKLDPAMQANYDKWIEANKLQQALENNDYDMQGYYKNEVAPYEGLKAQGFNDQQIADVQQGLNGGNKELANFIVQNKIKSPTTPEEIQLAYEGKFNNPTYDANTQHFTDKYKMPNHETFSNESIYATGDNAKYAGKWQKDANGNDVFVAPKQQSGLTQAGELLGSVSRVAQNPLVAGLITALVANKVNPSGGWRNAANVGLDMAKYLGQSAGNKAVLKSMGYNVPNAGAFGVVSDGAMKSMVSDYNNRGRLANTHESNMIRATDVQNKGIHYANQDKNAERKTTGQLNRWDSQNKTDQIRANNDYMKALAAVQNANTNAARQKNGIVITHISKGNGKTEKKQINVEEYNSNLAKALKYRKDKEKRKIVNEQMTLQYGSQWLKDKDKIGY